MKYMFGEMPATHERQHQLVKTTFHSFFFPTSCSHEEKRKRNPLEQQNIDYLYICQFGFFSEMCLIDILIFAFLSLSSPLHLYMIIMTLRAYINTQRKSQINSLYAFWLWISYLFSIHVAKWIVWFSILFSFLFHFNAVKQVVTVIIIILLTIFLIPVGHLVDASFCEWPLF